MGTLCYGLICCCFTGRNQDHSALAEYQMPFKNREVLSPPTTSLFLDFFHQDDALIVIGLISPKESIYKQEKRVGLGLGDNFSKNVFNGNQNQQNQGKIPWF
jgi:hypothetical protein